MLKGLLAFCPPAADSAPALWRRIFALQPPPDRWALVCPSSQQQAYSDDALTLSYAYTCSECEDQLHIDISSQHSYSLQLHTLLVSIHYHHDDELTVRR